MSYLEFLNYLLSFGPKLPAIMASVERIVTTTLEEIENIRTVLDFKAVFKAVPASEAEAAAEQAVIEAAMEGRSAGPFQNILDFIRNNPELIAFILSFLKK